MDFTETAKTIRQEIRNAFKGTGVKVSVRGRDYLSIDAAILEAPFDVLNNGSTYEQLNHFYYEEDDRLTEEGKAVCRKIMQIMRKYHYDKSDAMIDYFDTNFYIHLEVGNWDRPFKRINREAAA